MKKFLKYWNAYGMFALLLVLIVFFGITQPGGFLTKSTVLNVLRQSSIIGTLSCGVMMIIITGATDISVGGRVAFIVVMSALLDLKGVNIFLIIIAAILFGSLTGVINAILAEKLKCGVFVVSIATNNMWYGLAYIFSGGKMLFGLSDGVAAIAHTKLFGGLTSIVVIWFVCCLISSFILGQTRFGRSIYALGGNRDAAFLAGIDVVKTNILTMALAGAFIGVGALLLLSRNMNASPSVASSYAFECITACVLGGVLLGGGRGKVYQAAMGVLVTYVLFNGVTLFGVSDFVRQIITGCVMLLALMMGTLTRNVEIDLSDDTAGGRDAEKGKTTEVAK